MIKFFLSKPTSVIMVFIGLMILGLISLKKLPVSPLPNINIPKIEVRIEKDGLSSKYIESLIISKLRLNLSQLSQLEKIESKSFNDYGMVQLFFKHGTDMNLSFIEVNEKVDRSMNELPTGMERPKVIKSNISEIPIFFLNLSLRSKNKKGDHFYELSDFAKEVIKRRLEQLPEIAYVDLTGTETQAIAIKPKQNIVKSLNVTDRDFIKVLEDNTFTVSNIQLSSNQFIYNIELSTGRLHSLDDIKNLLIKKDDRIFKIGDIAEVEKVKAKNSGAFYTKDGVAISMAVIKQPEANLGDLRDVTSKMIKNLEKDYPDIHFTQAQDQTQLLEFSISNLKQDLIIGSVLAFLVLFIFLKDARAPFLIAIVIPVCILICLLFMKLLNLSINVISLSGLVLSVGLMIDNSIIVIDNVNHHLNNGEKLFDACIKGPGEVFRPLLTSACTTCSVFVPLVFLSGIAGALFYEQALAIAIGLFTSLILSLTLLPVCYLIIYNRFGTTFTNRRLNLELTFFGKIYEYLFRWTFDNKLMSVAIVTALIFINVILFKVLPKEKLPKTKQTEAVLEIDWSDGTSIGESIRMTNNLIKDIQKDVSVINANIGRQQFLLNTDNNQSESQASIYLMDQDDRKIISVLNKIKRQLPKKYPGASINIHDQKNIFEQVFDDDEYPVVVEVSSDHQNLQHLSSSVSSLSAKLAKAFPAASIAIDKRTAVNFINFNSEKLLIYNIDKNDIISLIKRSIGGKEIGEIQSGQDRNQIILPPLEISKNNMLSDISIETNGNGRYPLSEFAHLTDDSLDKVVYGNRAGNYLPIRIRTENPGEIQKFLQNNQVNENLKLGMSGSYLSNKKLLQEMGVVITVSVLLLYFILAIQFESFLQPFIVLLELPISMSGALLMLFIFNSSINLMSMIGLIVMSGIIINDSILKIDTINQMRRNEKLPLLEAIHVSGKRRLNSILMTCMVTLLSVIPFLFGSDIGSTLQRPLSLTLIGGMIIGTPVSLFFIPLVYWFFFRNRK
jgi:multidrug efflux pump subunit AcrB